MGAVRRQSIRIVLVPTVKDTVLVIVQDGVNSLTRMFFVDEVTKWNNAEA